VYETFAKACKLVPVKDNLIDLSSDDRKSKPALSQTWVLKQEFTGLNSGDKIAYLRGKMKENQCDCYVVTALDEIAWILNSNHHHPFS
jgi:Xaa-Pro aminopeptidase